MATSILDFIQFLAIETTVERMGALTVSQELGGWVISLDDHDARYPHTDLRTAANALALDVGFTHKYIELKQSPSFEELIKTAGPVRIDAPGKHPVWHLKNKKAIATGINLRDALVRLERETYE